MKAHSQPDDTGSVRGALTLFAAYLARALGERPPLARRRKRLFNFFLETEAPFLPQTFSMQVIAHIRSDFQSKFGIPRQSGLVNTLQAQVVFEPPFRDPQALRGLEGFSHLWLIWLFSETAQAGWSPTVRPPKLGGNTRMGVFATRSPFRPNPIGLSSVRLEKIEWQGAQGPVLQVVGADLMDGTPILDIKPYLAYVDAHPQALGGFALQTPEGALQVDFPPALLGRIPADRQEGLIAVLAQDPRPAYQDIPGRVYGMPFAGFEVRFTVQGRRLTVLEVQRVEEGR